MKAPNTPHAPRENKYVQFVKYCTVGVLNTLITLAVIYLCKSFLDLNLYLSNAIGYIAGLANSFIFNKNWVFHSKGRYRREAAVFIMGFLVCYAIQLFTVWAVTTSWPGPDLYQLTPDIAITPYGIATLLGNVAYTLANFIYNRTLTFRQKKG